MLQIISLTARRRRTAKKLLKEFGTMENLANTDKLKGKMKENIEANKEKDYCPKLRQ
jgi:DNA polymerase-1